MSLSSLVFHSSRVHTTVILLYPGIYLQFHSKFNSTFIISLFIHLVIFIYTSTLYSVSYSSIHPCASTDPFSNHVLIYEYLSIICHLLVYSFVSLLIHLSVLSIYLFFYLSINLFMDLSTQSSRHLLINYLFTLSLLFPKFLTESQIHILYHFKGKYCPIPK